jgi:hypothetical protein
MSVESKELTQLCWNDSRSYEMLMSLKTKPQITIGIIFTVVAQMAYNTNKLFGAETFSPKDVFESCLELCDKIKEEN